MLREMHLGFRLEFDSPEDREDSEDIIMRVLGINTRLNLQYLRKHPDTPNLYDTDVVYTKPDQADGRPPLDRAKLTKLLSIVRDMGQSPETAMLIVRVLKGIEIFLDIPGVHYRGKGDCNELVPIRVAELWRGGVAASPYIVRSPNDRGGFTYHAIVAYPDGSYEDPSRILGMGGPAAGAERAEEIRKQFERMDNYTRDALYQDAAEGLLPSPTTLAQRIGSLGLVPKSGVFKSPYGRAA